MTYGSFNVAGIATPTTGTGYQPLGPFAIPFSNTSEVLTVVVNTTLTVPVPSSAGGVAIIPPPANTNTLTFRTVNGDTGTFLSPQSPSFIEFDTVTPHVPSNIYLVSGASLTLVLQFL